MRNVGREIEPQTFGPDKLAVLPIKLGLLVVGAVGQQSPEKRLNRFSLHIYLPDSVFAIASSL